MQIGGDIDVSGFVTQLKYLQGQTLWEIGARLGYAEGRLADGAVFATLSRLPTLNEFENRGYSQVAGHRHRPPSDHDPIRLRRMAMLEWAIVGPDRLIKVLPNTRHDETLPDDVQYPPGLGIPQWKLIVPIPGQVAAILSRLGDRLWIGL